MGKDELNSAAQSFLASLSEAVESYSDEQAREEEKAFKASDESEDYFAETHRQLELQRKRDDLDLRKSLANWAKWLSSFYIGLVLFICTFNDILQFNIPSEVLITLLGTTTTTVIGIIYIVMRDLFSGK